MAGHHHHEHSGSGLVSAARQALLAAGEQWTEMRSDVFAALAEYVAAQRMDGRKILIAAYSEGSRDRLGGMMQAADPQELAPRARRAPRIDAALDRLIEGGYLQELPQGRRRVLEMPVVIATALRGQLLRPWRHTPAAGLAAGSQLILPEALRQAAFVELLQHRSQLRCLHCNLVQHVGRFAGIARIVFRQVGPIGGLRRRRERSRRSACSGRGRRPRGDSRGGGRARGRSSVRCVRPGSAGG